MNFKNIKTVAKALLLGSVIFATSCSEEFLEQTPPSSIDFETAIKTEADLRAATNGLYSRISSASTFGRDIPVIGELISDNSFVSISNSNRFTQINNYSWTFQNGTITGSFRGLYNIILRANIIINANDVTGDATNINNMKGEAYTARALAYFYLVNLWGQPVNSNFNQSLGVSINTSTTEPFAQTPRSSVGAVYNFIEDDLTTAINLLTGTPDKIYFSKTAAQLLLSRVYLYQERWDLAQDLAEDVLATGSPVSSAQYNSYWTSEGHPSTIFEISYTGNDNLSTNSLAYIYDQAGYGQNLASDDLYDSHDASDIRRNLYSPASRGDIPAGYVATKYRLVGGQSTVDLKLLRYSEAQLNLIEAKHRQSDPTALTDLNNFTATRSGVVYTSSGAQLLSDILEERRKELAMEGHRFFDLRRNGMDIIKGANCVTNCNMTFPNTKFVLLIPESEITNNGSSTQNPL